MELEPRMQAPAHATGAVEFVPLSAIEDDTILRLREEGDVSMLAASLGRLGQLVPVELRPVPGDECDVPRYQVVAGFRRIAALRLLRRDQVLARVHTELSDEDALALALSQALLTEPLDRAAVEALRARIEPSGVAPWAIELLDEALVRAPVEPELREQFLDYLTAPDAGGPSDDAGLDGDATLEDAADLSAMEGGRGRTASDGANAGPAGDTTDAEAEGEEVEMTPEELATDLARRMYEVNADLGVAAEAWADIPPEGRAAIVEQARWIAELLPSLEQDVED